MTFVACLWQYQEQKLISLQEIKQLEHIKRQIIIIRIVLLAIYKNTEIEKYKKNENKKNNKIHI
jgi:hypothetical protein